ncbi:hypothetical protein [Terriglobus saanensis]|jgi:hypothetical protein|uniref:Uncharacterized protein n=1 Tax=Terriglobus saanensis (strain ATCC BAA-1853 / DSM 23119 / SP1PR4) TaxID=401053 RepID=E8V588_TERSS|nr:hypothetical protein [Terriglobus saanensis]ADV84847.1 hypothetical protein AciPR4_4099 [Terriglobus saanensis SP1PR4]
MSFTLPIRVPSLSTPLRTQSEAIPFGSVIPKRCRDFGGLLLAILFVFLGICPKSVSAQGYPGFPAATLSNSATPLRGITMVPFHSDFYGNILYSFYANTDGRLAYAYSADGSNFLAQDIPGNGSGGFFNIAQDAAIGDFTAAVGSVVFNANTIFLGYVEAGTYQLVIVEADFIPGVNWGLSFHEVYRDRNAGGATTAPGMVIAPNGNVVAMYGTSGRSSVLNEGWTTYRDVTTGIWSSKDANLNCPTQPGLANFRNSIYMVQRQNGGGGRGIWENILDNTGFYINGTGHQIIGSTYWGLSMLVWQGELIFAAQENNGEHALDIYASLDGVNWVTNRYFGIDIGATPGIALYNGGLTAAFKANDARYVTYATHSTP